MQTTRIILLSFLIGFCVFLLTSPQTARAEVHSQIEGRVLDEQDQPIKGAAVVIRELNTGTSTDLDGAFRFKELKAGVYNIEFNHLGYSGTTRKIKLTEEPAKLEVVLSASYIELREVVISENRYGLQEKEHSLNISKVNREYLSENPGMTLMQSLERLPGVNSMDIGTGISKPVIRGLGFNRVIVAENNIKQQGQQWGADHGLEIDPNAIERVEVIKGPSSLLFGSDAIGGAINIKPPAVPQENTFQANTSLQARSNNDLLGFSQMAAVSRNGKFLRARFSFQDYADYKVPADSFAYNTWIMPIKNQRLKNTSGREMAGTFTAGMRQRWGITSLTVSHFNQTAGFFPGSHGVPDPSALEDPGDPRSTSFPKQKINHFKIISNSNIMLGDHWLEVDLGFQQNHRQELNPPHVHGVGPLPEGNLELELILNTFSANARFHHNLASSRSFIYGLSANYQENQRGGYNFLLPDFNAADAGIYSIFSFQPSEQWFLNAGVRSDISTVNIAGFLEPVWEDQETISHYRVRSPEFENTWVNLTGNAGVSWLPAPFWNLKLNFGSSYRTPNPIELSANGVHHGSFRHEKGDTSLTSERSLQLDVSLIFNRKDLYIAVSPFVNYFPNFLFLNPSGNFSELPGAGQIYRFEQAEALHLGGEVYTDWHITKALHTSLGIEWIWAQNLEDHYPLPFTPPPMASLEISYEWENLSPVLEKIKWIGGMRIAGSQNRVARNEPATEGYTLFNTGVMTRINAGEQSIEVSLHVQNLLDVLYKNHLSFYRKLELPEPGRNFTLRVNIPLKTTF